MTGRASWGESSIHQAEDGRWHGYVSMGNGHDGGRDRRHVSGKRRTDVVRKVRALEEARDAGTALAAGKAPTVAEWLDQWITTIANRRLKPPIESYQSQITNHLVPLLGHHRLDRLQPEHLERAWADLEAQGLSAATALLNHRVLSRALKVAMQRGRVARNVAQLVDPPSVVRPEIVPLTAPEAKAVLQAAVGHRNAARWTVALALGLRQGEALGLRWSDVDLDAGILTVRHALQRQAGKGLVLVSPKSGAGRRRLVLPEPLRLALLAHREEQLGEQEYAEGIWQDLGFVFSQADGRPIGAPSDWAAWKALLARAGVRDARLHDARHTAATLLLQQGVPARVAMQLLGHSQISMSMHYTHVVDELAHAAAQSMAKALWD